jgi:polynucleotide 5'-hydroxyl-kinase GRC3/NOL9
LTGCPACQRQGVSTYRQSYQKGDHDPVAVRRATTVPSRIVADLSLPAGAGHGRVAAALDGRSRAGGESIGIRGFDRRQQGANCRGTLPMTRLHVPEAWQQSTATILQDRLRVILVLGGGDTGKSSYCRFLAGELLAAGQKVALVDADIGQKDIGPPAAVTLGYVTDTVERLVARPEAFYFIGSTSPEGRLLPLVVGTAQLANDADAPFVIVDTTGYVEGIGRVLKGYKIEAVRPDLIVAIERRAELEAILRAHRNCRTIRIRPSRKARPRDRCERNLARELAFALYFKEARRSELKLEDVAIQRSLLFTGEPVAVAGALYAERTVEGVVAVADGPIEGVEVAKWLKPGFERSLLCGVADERNRCVGLAVLEAIDFRSRTISLSSPVAVEKMRVLQLGDLYVGLDGRELGRVERRGI